MAVTGRRRVHWAKSGFVVIFRVKASLAWHNAMSEGARTTQQWPGPGTGTPGPVLCTSTEPASRWSCQWTEPGDVGLEGQLNGTRAGPVPAGPARRAIAWSAQRRGNLALQPQATVLSRGGRLACHDSEAARGHGPKFIHWQGPGQGRPVVAWENSAMSSPS